MKEELITKAYEIAKERYAAVGVDVDKAMDTLQKYIPVTTLLAGR